MARKKTSWADAGMKSDALSQSVDDRSGDPCWFGLPGFSDWDLDRSEFCELPSMWLRRSQVAPGWPWRYSRCYKLDGDQGGLTAKLEKSCERQWKRIDEETVKELGVPVEPAPKEWKGWDHGRFVGPVHRWSGD